MIRSGIARKPATAREPMKGARTRKCAVKGCMGRYVPGDDPRQVWCSDDCSVTLALAALAKRRAAAARAQKAAAKVERAETAARKEKVKRLADWIRETQVVFNSFIRERDRQAGYPCISSGLPLDWSGNNVDAGHYRSRGSAPHLRFDERNVHAQSKKENRYASGNAADFRIGLIARIGLKAVEDLESDQAPRKWTVDELRAIKETYRAKLKQLQAASK